MPRKKRKGKDLEFLKSPTHVEGFLSLSNDEWGRAAKAVYRNYYGDDAFVRFGGALEDTEPQTGHGQSLKEFLWMTANNGITAYRETCDRNAIAGEISAQKRKEQNAIVNECQRVSTSVDTNQQVSTNRIEENRIEEKKKIPKENAQIEFALEGGACSGKHEKATCYSFEDFWKDYNIIEPTESLESAVKKLRKRNQKITNN